MIQKVQEETPDLSIEQLCHLFAVSRSWYYEQVVNPEEDEEETALRDRIEEIILEFSGYGYRRVTHALHREGMQVNHKRVLRIMQEESLLCRIKKSFVIKTTNSRHQFHVYPNLLAGLELTAPDQAWVSDFTYIRLRGAFVFLACILDAFSRRCIGWYLSRDMTTQLTLMALRRAIHERHPQPGVIHHSDRGMQYASYDYIEQLQQINAQISMSSVDDPYDNAKAESFFKTLKQEEVYLKEYRSFEEAEANLDVFLEQVYNMKRLHSSLGYVPPVEFEEAYASFALTQK
jgi:putative transposase